MKEPTQEQIKEFWEYFGIEFQIMAGGTNGYLYWRKSGTELWEPGWPDIDLNNLFKWAVPKLQDKGYQVDIVCFEHKGFAVSVLDICKDTAILSDIRDDNLGDALFWAIYQVIKE